MAKSPNPFDPLNLMEQFDPLKFMDQFAQTMQKFAPPGMPTTQLLEQQRKNMTALTEANQALLKGVQDIMQQQAELLQKATAEAGKAVQKMQATDPDKMAAKQAELMQENYGKLVQHMQETTAALNAAQQKALQTLEQRWREVMADFQKMA
ncbi:MAG: phasin family protein [Gammaproteobacteria bacterium]